MDRDELVELLSAAVERDMDGIYLQRNKIKALLSRLQPPGDGESTISKMETVQPSYADGYAKAKEDSAAKAESMAPVTSNHAAYTIAAAIRALAGKDASQ